MEFTEASAIISTEPVEDEEILYGIDSFVTKVTYKHINYAVKNYLKNPKITQDQLELYSKATNYLHKRLTENPLIIRIGETEVELEVNPIIWVGKNSLGQSITISPWVEGKNIDQDYKTLTKLATDAEGEDQMEIFFHTFTQIIEKLANEENFSGFETAPMNVKIIKTEGGQTRAILTDTQKVEKIKAF